MIHLNLFNIKISHKDNVVNVSLSEPLLNLIRAKIVTEEDIISSIKDNLIGDLSQINIYRLVVKSNYVFKESNMLSLKETLKEHIMSITECYYNMSFPEDDFDDYQYDYFEIMIKEGLMSIEELNYLSDFYDTSKAVDFLYANSEPVDDIIEDEDYINERLDELFQEYRNEQAMYDYIDIQNEWNSMV